MERRGGDYGTDHVFGFFREKGNCAGAIALDVLLDESHFIEKKRFSQKVYYVLWIVCDDFMQLSLGNVQPCTCAPQGCTTDTELLNHSTHYSETRSYIGRYLSINQALLPIVQE